MLFLMRVEICALKITYDIKDIKGKEWDNG